MAVVTSGGGAGVSLRRTRFSAAAADFTDGVRLFWLWSALAQLDIKQRYRGSMLGPFWQTLTTALLIGGLGIIYPRLFHMSAQEYLPVLATGLVFWSFITGMILEGCKAFTEVHHIINVVRLPFSVHVYRVVYRSVLTLAHNFVIVPIVLIIFPPPIDAARLIEIVPAFVIVTVNGVWITLLFGMISARYRDIPPVIASLVQLLLFVTPIFWTYEQLGPEGWWAQLNPFFAAIDVMRAPLVGKAPAEYSWDIMLLLTVVGSAVTFAFFARFRSRLPFWV